VPAERAGWWERYLNAEVLHLAQLRCALPGAAPGPVTFFAPPKKVTKERGSPVRRHYLVTSCGVPALLDQPGGLRNSRTVHAIPSTSGADCLCFSKHFRGSPILDRNLRAGLRCSASLRGPNFKGRPASHRFGHLSPITYRASAGPHLPSAVNASARAALFESGSGTVSGS